MPCLVVLNLETAETDAKKISAVEEKLSKYGFRKSIPADDQTSVPLPASTFAGTAGGGTSKEIAEAVREKVREILNESGVKGAFFVSVGDDWCWAAGKTS
ncbi:MAG: hypothetical protein KIS92_13420 [Planctomycetota bacterium]|nr:hypothetical protein [Planctomycetota bacterium]